MSSEDVKQGGISRRNLLIAGGLVLGAGALGVSLFATQRKDIEAKWFDELGELKIGYLPITDAAPLLVAHGAGTFAQQGIPTAEPTLFRAWPALVEAFQAKQVDVVHLLMPLAIQLKFANNADIKVLAWNHTNGSAITVNKSVQTPADLAGQTVAVPGWYSIHNVVLQQVLAAEGLTPVLTGTPSASEVKLVVVAPADMPAALASGEIAGYTVADPFNAVAEVKDIGHILRFTGDVWKDHACCVTVVRGDLVRDYPEAAQAIVNGLVQAQLGIREDPTGTAALLSQKGYLPQPLPAIEKALTAYDAEHYGDAITHPEWQSKRIDFQPFPYESYTKELITALAATKIDGDSSFLGDIDLGSAHRELVEVGLAEQAIRSNGGFSAFGLAGASRTEVVSP